MIHRDMAHILLKHIYMADNAFVTVLNLTMFQVSTYVLTHRAWGVPRGGRAKGYPKGYPFGIGHALPGRRLCIPYGNT